MSDYQVMPPLSAEEYAALKADIAAHGVRVPVDVDEDGRLLDGHHRVRIAAELDIEYPTRVMPGLTDEEKHDHALAVNAQRRQLSREQRRDLVTTELRRDPSRSDRAIARLCGVDHKTVGAIRGGGWGISQQPARCDEGEPRSRRSPRRRSLPDAYWDGVYELGKAVDRLERLHADDRFLTNLAALRERHHGDLNRIASTLLDLVHDIAAGGKS